MIYEQIREMIAEQFDIGEEQLTMETSFKDDLNADSLDLVELVMAIEDGFDLEFEDEDIDIINTIEDAVNYIDKMID